MRACPRRRSLSPRSPSDQASAPVRTAAPRPLGCAGISPRPATGLGRPRRGRYPGRRPGTAHRGRSGRRGPGIGGRGRAAQTGFRHQQSPDPEPTFRLASRLHRWGLLDGSAFPRRRVTVRPIKGRGAQIHLGPPESQGSGGAVPRPTERGGFPRPRLERAYFPHPRRITCRRMLCARATGRAPVGRCAPATGERIRGDRGIHELRVRATASTASWVLALSATLACLAPLPRTSSE
jgi:hypothetical protein